jgi:hypothetical protein
VRGFASLHLALDGGGVVAAPRLAARRIVDRFDRLVRDHDLRQSMTVAGRRAIDGRGAHRVAGAILATAEAVSRA